jgi:hypothetical protein
MTDKDAMKLALFALDIVKMHYTQSRHVNEAITALKERLADPMREVQRLGQEIEQEPVAWRNAAIRVGEDLSSVGPDGYYDMTAQQWLDWAMEQQPHGKNSLAQPEQERNFCSRCGKRTKDLTHIHTCTPPKENT